MTDEDANTDQSVELEPEVLSALEQFKSGEIDEEALEGQLEGLPENARAVLISQTVSRHRGPLPKVDDFAGYEDVCPGAADRILAMAEKEQDRRLNHDDRAQSYFFRDRLIGYIAGFTLLLILIFAAIYCIYIGQPKWALLFMGTGALAVVARFLPGTFSKKN